jgi:hypothetical protein
MSELRDKMTDEDKERHATTYQASRGGWVKQGKKPAPGTPK